MHADQTDKETDVKVAIEIPDDIGQVLAAQT